MFRPNPWNFSAAAPSSGSGGSDPAEGFIGDGDTVTVANYAALPSAAANSGKLAWVLSDSGTLWTKKYAGWYVSDGATWSPATLPDDQYVVTDALQTDVDAADTTLLQAYDVDGAAYVTFATLTAGNTPTFDLSTSTTVGSKKVVGGAASSTDNAFVRWDGATGGVIQNSTSATLDDTGNAIFTTVTAGSSDSMTVNGAAITSQNVTNSNTQAVTEIHTYSATAGNGAVIYGARARGSLGAASVVQSGDTLYSIAAVGYDGTDYALGGRIDFIVDGTPDNNDMPTKMVFSVSADGSHSPTEAFRINATGKTTFAGSVIAPNIPGGFGITIDGGGSAITTGVKGYVRVPYAMTITEWELVADQSGSIVIDVWKDTYANYPPTVADTIAGTEKPTLSSATKNQDTSLSSWTTSVAAGDYIGFNVDSATTVTRVHLAIKGTRT